MGTFLWALNQKEDDDLQMRLSFLASMRLTVLATFGTSFGSWYPLHHLYHLIDVQAVSNQAHAL